MKGSKVWTALWIAVSIIAFISAIYGLVTNNSELRTTGLILGICFIVGAVMSGNRYKNGRLINLRCPALAV